MVITEQFHWLPQIRFWMAAAKDGTAAARVCVRLRSWLHGAITGDNQREMAEQSTHVGFSHVDVVWLWLCDVEIDGLK